MSAWWTGWSFSATRTSWITGRRYTSGPRCGTTGPVPEISVVMPAFNAQETVLQAIDSVRAQTFEDWELLVVDDRSTDGTAERVREIAASDPRVKLTARER